MSALLLDYNCLIHSFHRPSLWHESDISRLQASDSRRMKINLEPGKAQMAADVKPAADLSDKEKDVRVGDLKNPSQTHTRVRN